jgi:hypothetical protein
MAGLSVCLYVHMSILFFISCLRHAFSRNLSPSCLSFWNYRIANVNPTQHLILKKIPKRLLFHFYSLHEIWLFIYSYVFAIKLKERKKERQTDRQKRKKDKKKEEKINTSFIHTFSQSLFWFISTISKKED